MGLIVTPVENQNLIQHYLTIVKQQRADNPPPPPFVDPLTSDERIDGIIKNVLADQEAELDNKISFNQSLREYRKVKKMEAIARRTLSTKLLNDPRPTLHSQDFDAQTFNIRFERYQEALVHAQEIEVQATQTKDKTVITTTKVLKIETRPAPIEKPIPKVTGNIHLDKHLAKTTITKKQVSKTVDKPIKKKLLPLESTLGDSPISSFTTEPYFEDLEPTTSLPSPFLKKIALKKEVPVTSDSESELDIENFKKPTNQPSSPVLKKIASRKALLTLSDSEDEIDEDPITPILNPSTLIRKDEQASSTIRSRSSKPRRKQANTRILGDYHEPLSSDKSRASSEMESESEDEIPEAEIIRILIKKQVKIHAKYLKATSNEQEDRKNGTTSSKREQPPRPNSLELQPGPNSLDQQSQPNPFELEQKSRSLEQQPKTDSLEPSRKQQTPREESEDLKDEVRWRKVHRATAVLGAFFRHTKSSKLLRVVEKCYVKTAKTLSEISDQLSDPLPVQMGPLEKSLVYHLKKEIDKVSILVKDIHGTSNPEGIESLTTQIKYLRDTVYNLQNKQKELINSLPKQSNESISDVFASLRIEIKSLTDIASVLSQKPTPDISADIMEKLEQSEASILSNVKQDLITEVRVYVQKEVETLTTTVTTSFEGIMSQLRNMEQNSNDKFNHLQRDIVEIKKEIISVDNRVAKAESNRLTSPLTHSSPTPFKTVVETENKNSPSKDLTPHQTQSIKEDDDRGPRLTEKEVGKLLPPLLNGYHSQEKESMTILSLSNTVTSS
ncbi:hypothetical protein H4Q26_009868 [Puccinia striiformis f. sp. tritici PST-130]|nr:hypothetical protein H4Q26_009868 [Puccinia striiformis f. sp. tritici PST-130]